MEILLALSVCGFAVLGGVLGYRLIRLSRRTQGRPELLVGIGLTSYACVCQPMLLLVGALQAHLTALTRLPLDVVGITAAGTTVSCLFAFTRLVFRPRETWARLFFLSGVSVAVATGLGMIVVGSEDPYFRAIAAVNFAASFAWAGVESLLYRARFEKRRALGVERADPLLSNRFLVWGGSMAVAAALSAVIGAIALNDQHIGTDDLATSLALVATLVNAAGWWLSFLTPAWYRSAVLRAAAVAAD